MLAQSTKANGLCCGSLSDLRRRHLHSSYQDRRGTKKLGMVITLLVLGLYARDVVAYDRVTDTLTSPRDNRLRHQDALG